ncbi:NAD-dependent epimerase/dehydratase family protein [Actinokineospora sp. UTMC 2448]|uniref:NAD-dependent epimerase/dehydratase family protein n=1 Tax=Actinokineospora sp. UTMC 2448 TaxID=2268449 RepID=UPI00216409E5|nr:NAD-dependent epimerase/dehydratase family protein [Actinokineospora sp. UTMC 2448]UVS82579.1 Putative NADH-flavin reductase [Actinokineospora sp. UTMC 2448]
MRILILGGTRFVGHTTAAAAVAGGHDVVCAARGESGAVPDGARLVKVDRDQPDGLAPLAGESFDAVVDVAPISHTWVRRALDAFGSVGHWTFVSSISVYAHPDRVDDVLLPPRQEHFDRSKVLQDPEAYGSIKVASENAVLETMGDRAFIVRAGLITGPGDPFDRFGYWPMRLHRGGRVAVPDVDQLTQIIDVGDLAAWIVDAAERGTTGVYDGIGPAQPLLDVLRTVADAVGSDAELVRVPESVLTEHDIAPWAGPRSLPLWLPASHRGMSARDAGPALAAGLTPRPLAESAVRALEHEKALGLDRERKAGLPADAEAELLAAL